MSLTVFITMLTQLEDIMSALQSKCRAAETESTELQEEIARCKRELKSQSTRIDELIRYLGCRLPFVEACVV